MQVLAELEPLMIDPEFGGSREMRWDEEWDALVIGAGPAGALAAHGLATVGTRVLLVDKRRFPRAKVCGGCLNGRALSVLDSAGLGGVVSASSGVPLSGLQLHLKNRSASIEIPVGSAIARDRFDAELVGAAVTAGARFLPETCARVGEVIDGTRRVQLAIDHDTHEVRARVILIASGLAGSCLPPNPSFRTRVARNSRIGVGCRITHVPSGYEKGTIFMAVARGGYLGVVRMGDGSLNIAAAFQPELIRQHHSPGEAALNVLAEAGMPPIDDLQNARWEGTVGLTRETRPIAAERLFLVGDAAGYVEPFTGEGMTWALSTGQAVVPLAIRAIDRWDQNLLGEWDVIHRRLVRDRQFICRAMAGVLHRPWLARLGFEVLMRLPSAAGHILSHLNANPSLVELHEPCQ